MLEGNDRSKGCGFVLALLALLAIFWGWLLVRFVRWLWS